MGAKYSCLLHHLFVHLKSGDQDLLFLSRPLVFVQILNKCYTIYAYFVTLLLIEILVGSSQHFPRLKSQLKVFFSVKWALVNVLSIPN